MSALHTDMFSLDALAGVGKTPQRLAVGRYMSFAYAVW